MNENENPCTIGVVHNAEERLSSVFHLYDSSSVMPDTQVPKIFANAKFIDETYAKAVKILTESGFATEIPHLTYKLIPRFGTGKIKLRDQKIGGIPDLRGCLYTKMIGNRYNLDKIWPRCGCCHGRMRFVGQFDLLPWIVPIAAFTGDVSSRYGRIEVGSIFSFRFTDHSMIYKDHMFHVFACPFSGQHFDNPNFDSEIMVSSTYTKMKDEESDEAALKDSEKYYRRSLPKVKRDENSMKLKHRKIDGWDFRFCMEGSSSGDYEAEDQLETILKEHPDVFDLYGTDFQLFGEPTCQQTPRRFFCSHSYAGPKRMVPFLGFSDDEADFSYQIYADLLVSDGYTVYGKIDGSCT